MINKSVIFEIIVCALGVVNIRALRNPKLQENGFHVRTTSGLVEGMIETTLLGKTITSFYGIPYAKPPLGKLRFRPPEPVQPWTQVLKTHSKPEPCYQQYPKDLRESLRSSQQLLPRPWSEDCLKLSILVANTSDSEQPVIVFLHGGEFSYGSSISENVLGKTFTAEVKTVTVVVNYRLGVFGFLYLGHPNVPGSVGLLDQRLALQWVNENVEFFSGKRKAIFLIGENAGAASVGYHVLSKGSAGLFVTGGLFEGAPNCDWAYDDPGDSLMKATMLADHLGCKHENVSNMMECFRSKHPEDIVRAATDKQLQFKPTVDGYFLPESPLGLLKSGRINNFTNGVLSAADQGSRDFLNQNIDILRTQDGRLSRFDFRRILKRLIPNSDESRIQSVELQYLNSSNLEDSIMLRDAAREIYGDYSTNCCLNEYAQLVAESNSIVMRGVWNKELRKPREWMGPLSTQQLESLRGDPLLGEEMGYTKEQQAACRAHITSMQRVYREKVAVMLSKFPRFTPEQRQFVLLGITPQLKKNYRQKQCEFWKKMSRHK